MNGKAGQLAPASGVGAARVVYDVDLQFDPDGDPYPQHANIIGWQDSADKPDTELKHFWMNKAQMMAPKFKFKSRQ